MNADIAVAAAKIAGEYTDVYGYRWVREPSLNMWHYTDPEGERGIWRGHAYMERAIREENP
jgi:hypothetical protein